MTFGLLFDMSGEDHKLVADFSNLSQRPATTYDAWAFQFISM